jgi:hypothetical protein
VCPVRPRPRDGDSGILSGVACAHLFLSPDEAQPWLLTWIPKTSYSHYGVLATHMHVHTTEYIANDGTCWNSNMCLITSFTAASFVPSFSRPRSPKLHPNPSLACLSYRSSPCICRDQLCRPPAASCSSKEAIMRDTAMRER